MLAVREGSEPGAIRQSIDWTCGGIAALETKEGPFEVVEGEPAYENRDGEPHGNPDDLVESALCGTGDVFRGELKDRPEKHVVDVDAVAEGAKPPECTDP
jgi:hypothetical protein